MIVMNHQMASRITRDILDCMECPYILSAGQLTREKLNPKGMKSPYGNIENILIDEYLFFNDTQKRAVDMTLQEFNGKLKNVIIKTTPYKLYDEN